MRLAIFAVLVARPAAADPGDRWDGVMMLEQVGGGVGGGVVLATAGFFIGGAIDGSSSEGENWLMHGATGGIVAGALTGVTLGVKITGDLRGGNGSWLATATGAAAGGLLTVVTASQYFDKIPDPLAFSVAATTLVVPTMLAYHFTTSASASATEKRVFVPLVLLPF